MCEFNLVDAYSRRSSPVSLISELSIVPSSISGHAVIYICNMYVYIYSRNAFTQSVSSPLSVNSPIRVYTHKDGAAIENEIRSECKNE